MQPGPPEAFRCFELFINNIYTLHEILTVLFMSSIAEFLRIDNFFRLRPAVSILAFLILFILPNPGRAEQGDFSMKIMGGIGLRTVQSTGELFLAAPLVPVLINQGNYEFNTTGQTFLLESSQDTRLRTEQNHARIILEWLVDDDDYLGVNLGLGYLESDNECIQWCGEATEKAIQFQLFQPGADQTRLLQDLIILQAMRPELDGRKYQTLQFQFGFNIYLNPGGFWNPYLGLTLGIGPCASECFLSSRAAPVLGLQLGSGMVIVDLRAEYGFEGFMNVSGASPTPDPLPTALLGIGLRF